MAFASTYSIMKTALVTLLEARPALAGITNVLNHLPVNKDEMRTKVGTNELIAMGGATGTYSNVVFTDGGLRFDEDFTLDVHIEVHGSTSIDTQAAMDARVNELLYELLHELARQAAWNQSALGLDIFDYLIVTPVAQDNNPGRLQQTGVFAAGLDLGIRIEARRNFT